MSALRRRRYRCALRQFLNRPGWHGRATLIATVEDTSKLHLEELRFTRVPDVHLSISDCARECELSFDLETVEGQRNSLYKLDTLIRGLERFRGALVEEIELVNARSREFGW